MKFLTNNFFQNLMTKKEFIVIVLIIILFLFLVFSNDIFLNKNNINSLQTSIAPKAIIATGMMILLITGVFDLSVGSVMGLAGVVTSLCIVKGISVGLSIMIGLLTGMGFGFFNGILVAIVGVNPLITTISTMYMGRSLINVLLEGSARHGIRGFSQSFVAIGANKTFGLYNMVWIMLIIVIAMQIIITKTTWGKKIYYFGGNPEAAKMIGINTKKIRITTYVFSGLLAALAGILVTARFEMASRVLGSGLELNIIISCLVGGGSITGGRGSVMGALLGCIFMSLVQNSFTILQIGDFWQSIVIGSLLILVVTLDAYFQMRDRKKFGKIV